MLVDQITVYKERWLNHLPQIHRASANIVAVQTSRQAINMALEVYPRHLVTAMGVGKADS